MSALDRVVAFARVLGSSLASVAGSLPEALFNLTTIGDFPSTPSGPTRDGDSDGEQHSGQPGYGPLGWIARPLDANSEGAAEAAALRADDQLNPFGWRDLRILRAINAGGGQLPAKGQVGGAGYGGALMLLTPASAPSGSRKPDILTLYVPHDFDGSGEAQKAHAIIVDPSTGNSGITLVHANGMRVALSEDGITLSADGSTFLSMRPGEIALTADSITIKGNVALGKVPESGIPIALNTLAPSPSVFGSLT